MRHGHHHHHHDVTRHDDHIGSFVLFTDEAIPAGDPRYVPRAAAVTHGPKLLRLKGIVKLAEMPDTPVVVHGVQHVFHPTGGSNAGPMMITAPGSSSSPATSGTRCPRVVRCVSWHRRPRPAGPDGPDQ